VFATPVIDIEEDEYCRRRRRSKAQRRATCLPATHGGQSEVDRSGRIDHSHQISPRDRALTEPHETDVGNEL